MSIRSFAADLLPAKLHGLARSPAAATPQAEVTTFAELAEKLGYLSKSDLKKVRETIEIFAPIAHRLGLNQMYRELQDLSFRFMYPWRYAAVAKALERARGTRRDIVDRMRRDVEKAFAEARTKVTVFSREKTVF